MIICAALERGLTLSDFENMTIGMIIDYTNVYNKRNGGEGVRDAEQADFDAF